MTSIIVFSTETWIVFSTENCIFKGCSTPAGGGMAEPTRTQYRTPSPTTGTIAKAPDNVSQEDIESFTHIDFPLSPSQPEVQACSGPHLDDLQPNEEVDLSRHTLRTTPQKLDMKYGTHYNYRLASRHCCRRTVDWSNSVYRDSCNVGHDICGN